MTYREFIKRLAETRRKWYLSDYGGFVRFKARKNGRQHCPISAVAGSQPCNDEEGAGMLGLRNNTRKAIVHAADGWREHNPRIRRDILKACGLYSASEKGSVIDAQTSSQADQLSKTKRNQEEDNE